MTARMTEIRTRLAELKKIAEVTGEEQATLYGELSVLRRQMDMEMNALAEGIIAWKAKESPFVHPAEKKAVKEALEAEKLAAKEALKAEEDFSTNGSVANDEFIAMVKSHGFKVTLRKQGPDVSYYIITTDKLSESTMYVENHNQTVRSKPGLLSTPPLTKKNPRHDWNGTEQGEGPWKKFGTSTTRTCFDFTGKSKEGVMKMMMKIANSELVAKEAKEEKLAAKEALKAEKKAAKAEKKAAKEALKAEKKAAKEARTRMIPRSMRV